MTVLSTSDIQILRQIKRISETRRNPDYNGNKRKAKSGKICNRAAKPSDLGASRRDQGMTKAMYYLAYKRYLKLVAPIGSFPYFQITELGIGAINSASKK